MEGKIDLTQFTLEKILNKHDDRKTLTLLGA